LEGSPPVLALMERNPFPDKPPRYLRARLYEYRFSTAKERREQGIWWHREYKGEYLPVISLNSFAPTGRNGGGTVQRRLTKPN